MDSWGFEPQASTYFASKIKMFSNFFPQGKVSVAKVAFCRAELRALKSDNSPRFKRGVNLQFLFYTLN